MGGWFATNLVLRKYFIWFEIKLPLVGTLITGGAFVDVTSPSLCRYGVSKSLLGSDIGNTTPGGENRKFSQVSFYIIRIDK